MKKTMIAIMAVAAALTVVSCDKSEVTAAPDTEKQAQTLKLDLNIPSLDSDADTKAMKTGWVAGDKLNIWFDEWEPGINTSEPDLIITYDGSNWKAGELKLSAKDDGTARSLKASGGTMSVLYEGYNDLSSYATDWWNGSWYYETVNRKENGDNSVFASKLEAYSQGINYTYDAEANTLSAAISSFEFITRFKVLIKGVTDDMKNNASQYFLKITISDGASNDCVTAAGSICVSTNSGAHPKITGITSNNLGYMLGVKEDDGIAFYYWNIRVTNGNVKFELYKTGETTAMSSYTATGKTITTSIDKCKGIYINYSKFSATATE